MYEKSPANSTAFINRDCNDKVHMQSLKESLNESRIAEDVKRSPYQNSRNLLAFDLNQTLTFNGAKYYSKQNRATQAIGNSSSMLVDHTRIDIGPILQNGHHSKDYSINNSFIKLARPSITIMPQPYKDVDNQNLIFQSPESTKKFLMQSKGAKNIILPEGKRLSLQKLQLEESLDEAKPNLGNKAGEQQATYEKTRCENMFLLLGDVYNENTDMLESSVIDDQSSPNKPIRKEKIYSQTPNSRFGASHKYSKPQGIQEGFGSMANKFLKAPSIAVHPPDEDLHKIA